jgi:hypothetical protein
MEEQVFLQESVYTQLKLGFIEARLHMDGPDRIGADTLAGNRKLQKEFSKSVALPTFVVIDPKTRKTLGLMRGKTDVATWLDFLATARDKAPGKVRDKVGWSK